MTGSRDMVLAALREAGARGASGERLADAIGVSRVAVAKHIAVLRELGYTIEARHGAGYTLLSSPGIAIPEEVRPLLRDPLWVDVRGALETGSTNLEARALAEHGAPEGTVYLAASQSSGRGRLGRDWASPPGGAYMSMVLRPPVSPIEVGSLALAVAVGVAQGVRACSGVEPSLKWPNDVLVGGDKLAGILLEMAAEADSVSWVVAGVGVNVRAGRARFPDAAFLGDIADVSAAQVAASVLDGVADAYRSWLGGGFPALHEEYERLSALTGSEVTVSNAAGRVLAAGVVAGVDGEGRLLVSGDAGITSVASGEVTLR